MFGVNIMQFMDHSGPADFVLIECSHMRTHVCFHSGDYLQQRPGPHTFRTLKARARQGHPLFDFKRAEAVRKGEPCEPELRV